MNHPIEYFHTITFRIPEGYSMEGIEDANIHYFVDGEDGTRVAEFISNYEIEGNQVTVLIHEYYKHVYFPKSDYESFRSVINAAADFNKVALIFEKEGS